MDSSKKPKPEPLDHPSTLLTLRPSSSNPDVNSEYYRISELFRSSFEQRLQRNGDVPISIEPESDPYATAIVPYTNPEDEALSHGELIPRVVATRKLPSRSSELVRVTDLQTEEFNVFREIIRRTRMLFESLRFHSISGDDKNKDPMLMTPNRRMRADLKAANMMGERGLWLNRDKRIVGEIPGVSIGDVFYFRMELCVVGLHGQVQAGIDYVPASQSATNEPIATSIIVSGGYEDDEDAGDVIVYTGQGGQDKNHKQVGNQKLETGNLALEMSLNYGVEIRVIRGLKYEGCSSRNVYVYDGLYRITNSWFEVGKAGFGVYKFKLVRIENQVEMGSAVMKFAASLRARPLEARPQGYVTLDLSGKKENVPVLFYNDIDNDHDPINYKYLKTTAFPPYVYNNGNNNGCECIGGCQDNCLCVMKNGGLAYDHNGILMKGKPLIFECGPHCSCPLTCRNRVTQKGVKNRFEVFRSMETHWGVRSLDMIPAGSFICEFAGIVLTREQAQLLTMNGDSLIYPSRFTERWKEWGDLSQVFRDYACPSYPSVPPLDFALDVSKMRNLACYMSHSSSPNVFVQLVLYDHSNVSFPHLMLFAMENIPPLRDLSIDYGMVDEWTAKLAICN
ncbi:hypothetical protein RD792_017533 [Penstemon davidsonii]|uniref:Uncharacterized protein n=2 Tax=Penstemon davidsonii TaxID=160366 RepID=A0ABR0CMA4_9LAMI|nr:hypothetical protein RD792_017533 [Penstemon davidsonii]